MKNRHDISQLDRDAKKEGHWQAKLAYATYLLKYEANGDQADEKKAEAKGYLEEVIASGVREYMTGANILLESHFFKEKSNAVIVRSSLHTKNTHEQITYNTLVRPIYTSLEIKYKTIRYEYDKCNKPREHTINELEALLHHKEMTDALRAKIYFQLIRLHIEQAHIKGQRQHLEEAKNYCLLLTTDNTLSSMFKAKEATRIYDQIKDMTDKPKQLLKFVGIVVGNVLDLVTFELPKLLGNIVGGPIRAMLGVATYPISYLYNKYKSNQNIKTITNNIINLDKGEKKYHHSQSTHRNVSQTLAKKIFNHRNDHHDYGDIDYDEENDNPRKTVKVTHEFLSPNTTSKSPYAYGRVFGKAVPVNQDTRTVLNPVYTHTLRNI